MSHRTPDMFGPLAAPGVDLPRPQLAGALATALRTTTTVSRAVEAVATELAVELVICDQLAQLATTWRVALRRAESAAMDKLGVGLRPGAARRLDLECGRSVVIVHGDGWSLVGSTPSVLLFLLDSAPCLIIDRSRAEGAAGLVSGLACRLS